MKKITPPNNKSLKRQLLSGTIYVALAAVVVAVTLNTTIGLISDKTTIPKTENTSEENYSGLPNTYTVPELTLPDFNIPVPESSDNTPVSDVAEGIDSLIVEAEPIVQENLSESPSVPSTSPLSIPDGANLGLDKFIRPCNGFVSKAHSVDVPVYSPTMSDYRTHTGIDIVGDLGTEIYCVNGGIVTDIYDDDLYGTTVEIRNRSGYTMKYSNLMPTLSAGIEIGTIIKTGDPVGGIGETAICEVVETPHLHLEIYDEDGNPVDPEDLISF